ncbi:MAG: hypothetical protein WAX89_07710 [Alphaproteobacteria bacterium]
MWWVASALCSAAAQGGLSELNRYYKVPGVLLNFWRCLFSFLLLLPVVLYVPWPNSGWFYGVAIASGLVGMAVGIFFDIASKYNGRAANLYKPLRIFVMFFLWLAIDTAYRHALFSHPWQLVAIVALLAIGALAVLAMSKNALGWDAFIMSIPVSLLFAVGDTAAKLVIDVQWLFQHIALYMFFSFGTTVVLEGLRLWHSPMAWAEWKNPQVLKVSSLAAALNTLAFGFGLGGYVLAPNPAYSSAITLVVPSFLMLYHRIIGVKDDASPMAGLVLVLAALGLVLVTME